MKKGNILFSIIFSILFIACQPQEIQKKQNAQKLNKVIEKNKISKTNTEAVEFDDLYKAVKKELYKSYTDLGLILACEKIVLEKDLNTAKNNINEKYKTKTDQDITNYYFEFNKSKNNIHDNIEYVIDLMIEQYSLNNDIGKEMIIKYRNNAMHYQLQIDEAEKVRRYLEIIVKDKYPDYDRFFKKEKLNKNKKSYHKKPDFYNQKRR